MIINSSTFSFYCQTVQLKAGEHIFSNYWRHGVHYIHPTFLGLLYERILCIVLDFLLAVLCVLVFIRAKLLLATFLQPSFTVIKTSSF